MVNFTSDKEKFAFAKKNFSLCNASFPTKAQCPKLDCSFSLLKDEFNKKNGVLFAKWETLIALPQSTLSVQAAITTWVRTNGTVTLISCCYCFHSLTCQRNPLFPYLVLGSTQQAQEKLKLWHFKAQDIVNTLTSCLYWASLDDRLRSWPAKSFAEQFLMFTHM